MVRRVRILLAALLMVGAWPAWGAARSLVIENFHAEVVVGQQGGIEVTEKIRARFSGRWNGIFRTIPVEYRTPQGFNYSLLLSLRAVTDDIGSPLRYELSREQHYRRVKIWVPGAVDTVRTVVLRYRVRNGLRFFAEHDELYWNVTGDEWPVPIEAAGARIEVPAGVSGLRAVAYTGAFGSREQAARIAVTGTEVAVQSTRQLNFREGLTVAVGWDPGVVRRPGPVERVELFLRSNWMCGIPLGVFALMFGLWSTRGRDPRRRPIAPRYEPPEELTPAEVGTLVDNSPDMRDITATLVDLAVRGFLRIEEHREPRLLGLTSKLEYVFTQRKPKTEWQGLQPHERLMLQALFADGLRQVASSSDLENAFYRYLPGIREGVFSRLLQRRYYGQRPDKVRAVYICGGVAAGILLVVGGLALSSALGLSPLGAVAGGILSGAIVVGFGWVMPARTIRGTRALEGVLGFEDFLSRVEGDRLQRMATTPDMFEKFLPYAMALGVEKEWARAFEGIYKQPPDWYHGGDGHSFRTRSFVSGLGYMTTRAGEAMKSSPRSSGGSGFGGGGSSGGSSGGGFGGGGGGGF
jgi:uncharacterized membrane protein YgcG